MQIAVVVLCTFVLALVFGKLLIPALRALKAGQSIREIGPSWHNSKAGTPTMGGIMFIAAAVLCVVAAGWRSMAAGYRTHLYVLAFALVFGLIGFLDDFVKVKYKRNLGLTALQKLVLQLAAAAAYLALLRHNGDLTCDLYIPFWNVTFYISWPVYLIFAIFVMVGGLAAFLVYNHHPAKVFMGDTGSLFLGAAVCGLAFALDMPLILILVGFVYICETLSVILQVTYFKLTHGKRIFKMTPIHHHFELCGWSENKIVAVFAAVTVLLCVLAFLGVMGRY